MTKIETRELANIDKYLAAGMIDTAARALSALVRAARTRQSSYELMQRAVATGLICNPEFIV